MGAQAHANGRDGERCRSEPMAWKRGSEHFLAVQPDATAAFVASSRNPPLSFPRSQIFSRSSPPPSRTRTQDFATLAKWEDRGYYALRTSIEKSQRHLHKLGMQISQLLTSPCSAVLQAQLSVDITTAPPIEEAAAGVGSQEEPRPLQAGIGMLGSASDLACASRIFLRGTYSRCSSYLSFADGKRLGTGPVFEWAQAIDEMAGTIAQEASSLAKDGERGHVSRKRASLKFMFDALIAAGFSKSEVAVPQELRAFGSWLETVRPWVGMRTRPWSWLPQVLAPCSRIAGCFSVSLVQLVYSF